MTDVNTYLSDYATSYANEKGRPLFDGATVSLPSASISNPFGNVQLSDAVATYHKDGDGGYWTVDAKRGDGHSVSWDSRKGDMGKLSFSPSMTASDLAKGNNTSSNDNSSSPEKKGVYSYLDEYTMAYEQKYGRLKDGATVSLPGTSVSNFLGEVQLSDAVATYHRDGDGGYWTVDAKRSDGRPVSWNLKDGNSNLNFYATIPAETLAIRDGGELNSENSGTGTIQDDTVKYDLSKNEVLKGEFADKLNECLGNEGEKATAIMEEYNGYRNSFDQLTSTMNSLKQSGKWKDTSDIVVSDLQKRYDTLKTNLEVLKTVADAKDKLKSIRDDMKTEEEKIQQSKEIIKKAEDAIAALGNRPSPIDIKDSNGKIIRTDDSAGQEWDAKKKEQDDIISRENENISNSRKILDDKKSEAEKLLSTINDNETKIKDYKFKNEISYLEEKFKVLDGNKGKRTTSGPGGGGGGSGGGGDDSSVQEQKPIELPDMTADQVKIYDEMTIEQLKNLTELLDSYAKYKGVTLIELLKDVQYQDEVIDYLITSNSIPANLRESLANGDRAKSFALLNSLYSGGQPSVVGITENTKKTLATYLSNVAENNNMTFKDLMGTSGSKVLKTALSKFEGVQNNLMSGKDYKTNFIDIYDGNNISTLSEDTVNIERIYGDVVSDSQNKDIEKYFESNTINSDFETLGKFSVFSNTVSKYDDNSIRNVVYSMLT